MLRRILVLLFMVVVANTLLATHIVGGEMSYRCLGNDDYEITLKVYRDCLNGQASFDSKAAVTIYDSNKQIVRNDFFDFPGSTKSNMTKTQAPMSKKRRIQVSMWVQPSHWPISEIFES